MSNHRTELRTGQRCPQEARKPDKPTDLKGQSWKYGLRRALKEFSDDQCTDLAAALTYYAVLSLFPAVLAMVSLVGVVGQGPRADRRPARRSWRTSAASDVVNAVRGPMQSISRSTGAGFALVLGLATALWSASGYVGAFGRAMNRIYEIGEGRPFWKLRPLQILITLIAVVLVALVALSLVVTGPLAQAVGNAIGAGQHRRDRVEHRQVAGARRRRGAHRRDPLLRHAQREAAEVPLDQHRAPLVAIVVWVVASAVVRLLRRQLQQLQQDVRRARGRHRLPAVAVDHQPGAAVRRRGGCRDGARPRQLQGGIAAEDELQLPARDEKGLRKKEEKEQKIQEEGRALRQERD